MKHEIWVREARTTEPAMGGPLTGLSEELAPRIPLQQPPRLGWAEKGARSHRCAHHAWLCSTHAASRRGETKAQGQDGGDGFLRGHVSLPREGKPDSTTSHFCSALNGLLFSSVSLNYRCWGRKACDFPNLALVPALAM